ncbi:MAG TPA: sodium:proton antiporter [Geminicoccaceae bacterium]|nr:sodium:proton antiporter [Geminicoccaceae bacterium]
MTFSPVETAAVLIVLATVLGYLNYRFIGLPHTIGLTVMGALASLAVIAIDWVLPTPLDDAERSLLQSVDFSETLLNGMLSFLLFAGALHVELSSLLERKWTVGLLATLGVLVSTVLVALGFKAITWLLGFELSLFWCLVFGALISPTDPVAVLGILRSAGTPPAFEAKIAGESLFNDGVGVVVFAILLAAATGAETFSLARAGELFAVEAGGGVVLGLALGYLGFAVMKTVDEHNIEILITLSIVMGGYALAQRLHVSGPIAMAVAGLLIGNRAVTLAMSERTREHLLGFWSLLDEILNSVLFLLIGLEVIAIATGGAHLLAGLLAIPVVLGARAISVALPLGVIARLRAFMPGTYPMLVWGGLRGGISIALALTLPSGEVQALLLTTTYVVVVFSVAVQGTTVGLAARRLLRPEPSAVS